MKRILIALAMLAAFQVADAQVKTPDAAAKAVEKAVAAAKDAKKSAKVATWTKLAEAYIDAYNAPAGNAWIGASKQELMLLMGSDKPLSEEQVTLQGTPYIKETYANKEFYFNAANGQLAMIIVTKPVVQDALANALDAYKKAYEVDVKGSKMKDITAGISSINQKYVTDAYNAYQMGDLATASATFELAADAMNTAPLSQVDTVSIYNAGFTALAVNDLTAAKKNFEKCLSYGYYYDGGEVFSKLGEIYSNLGDKEASVAILEQGFTKFPQSQSILVGLINFYMTNNQQPDRLFELIDLAKKNEPNNASLYYVEGNIYKELGRIEDAAKAYAQCSEVNPEYEFGYIGAGSMYYDEAVRLQNEAAAELNDAKYNALIEQFEAMLMNAIDPFEKAFEITKNESHKVSISEYLKNIFYRFHSRGPEYQAKYEKYNEFFKNGQN